MKLLISLAESIAASEEHALAPPETPLNSAEVSPVESALGQETSPPLDETPAAVQTAAEGEFATPQPEDPVGNATETPVTVEVGAEVPDESSEPASVLEDVAPPAVNEGAAESTIEHQHTDSATVQDEQAPGASEEPGINEQAVADFIVPTIQQDDVSATTDEALISEADIAVDHPAAAHIEDDVVPAAQDLNSTGEEAADAQPIEPTPVQEEPAVETTQEPAVVSKIVEEDASLASEETPVPETDDTVDHVVSQPTPVVEDIAKELEFEPTPVQDELEYTATGEAVPVNEIIEDTPSVEEPIVSETEKTVDPIVDSSPSQEPEFVAEDVEETPGAVDIPAEVELPTAENPVSVSESIAAADAPNTEERIVSETETALDHAVEPAHSQEPDSVAEAVVEKSETAVVQEEVEQPALQEPLPVTENLEDAVTPISKNPPFSEPVITTDGTEEVAAPAVEEPLASETVIDADYISESISHDPESVVEVAEESEPARVQEEVEPHAIEEPAPVVDDVEAAVPVAEPLVSETEISAGDVVETAPQEPDAVAEDVAHELEPAAVHGELEPVAVEEPISDIEQVEEQEVVAPTAEETLVVEPATKADVTPAQDSTIPIVPQEPGSVGEEPVGEQSVEPTPPDAEIPLAAQEPVSVSEEVVDDVSGELAPAGGQHVPAIDEDNIDVAAEDALVEPAAIEEDAAPEEAVGAVVEEAKPIGDISRATEELEISDAAIATEIPSASASPIDEISVPVESAVAESVPVEPESAPLESADPATSEVPQAETRPGPAVEDSENIVESSTKAEEISQPSEVLDEDPDVLAAETEAADSNGNAEHQETTDIHRLEIPDSKLSSKLTGMII